MIKVTAHLKNGLPVAESCQTASKKWQDAREWIPPYDHLDEWIEYVCSEHEQFIDVSVAKG